MTQAHHLWVSTTRENRVSLAFSFFFAAYEFLISCNDFLVSEWQTRTVVLLCSRELMLIQFVARKKGVDDENETILKMFKVEITLKCQFQLGQTPGTGKFVSATVTLFQARNLLRGHDGQLGLWLRVTNNPLQASSILGSVEVVYGHEHDPQDLSSDRFGFVLGAPMIRSKLCLRTARFCSMLPNDLLRLALF